jgi:hypothetical protein
MPIRVLMRKMPPNVTMSIEIKKGQLPVSPPIVPASSVRSILLQATSAKERPGAKPAAHTISEIARIKAADTKASQPIMAPGPRERVLSNK